MMPSYHGRQISLFRPHSLRRQEQLTLNSRMNTRQITRQLLQTNNLSTIVPHRDCQICRSERSMRSMTYEHALFRATQKFPHSETNLSCIDTTQAKQLWDKSTPPRRDWSRIFAAPFRARSFTTDDVPAELVPRGDNVDAQLPVASIRRSSRIIIS
jgi:hypothetical protein